MFNQIELRFFKCFQAINLPLAPLTFLCGANASGKSSILQALVLLHQTILRHEWSPRLMLNGDSLSLGSVGDVVDKMYGRQSFEIGLKSEVGNCNWVFTGERTEMSLSVEKVDINGRTFINPKSLKRLFPLELESAILPLSDPLRRLTYITAERIGPRELYVLDDPNSVLVVGPRGEHAASVLHWRRQDTVSSELVIQGVPATLIRQVEARMKAFFPGCELSLQQIPETNAVALGFRTEKDTSFHRPIHMGFGLSQVFPIVVAALSAKVGDVLLIENPEVHLHPAGQALMGQFLSDVATSGIQVILESHSDHVLNGIRRSVKTGRTKRTNVAIHFFLPRKLELSQVTSPQIDANGNLDSWPEGFFDQFDKDTNYFAGWEE